MSEPTLKLPQNADELLRDFPVTEPNFEEQAKAITATLGVSAGTVAGGLSDDDLFRAPELAAEPGEPSLPALPSTVRAASAPKSNFAEMARKSLQKGEDDSAALAKELLAATAQSRRPNAEMVERVRAAGRVGPSATTSPLPTGELERPSGVVTRAAAAAATAEAPVPAAAAVAKPASPQRGTIVGFIGVAVAVAACVALYLKSNGPEQSPTTAALQAERAADAPAAAAKPAQAAPLAPKANQDVMNPETLAVAPLPAAAEAVKSAPGRVAAGAAAPASPAAKAAAAPSPGVKQETVDLQDDPAPPQAVAEKKPAEAAPEPQLKPAEGNSGSVPLSPSAGAISTALSSVRGGAQACLAGQSDPVTATVVFAADGHVQSVRASGANAACIQAALSKAHVAPFAKESFSASTTIRPP
jgi:hypothetical protein